MVHEEATGYKRKGNLEPVLSVEDDNGDTDDDDDTRNEGKVHKVFAVEDCDPDEAAHRLGKP